MHRAAYLLLYHLAAITIVFVTTIHTAADRSSPPSAIALLTSLPSPETIKFALELAQEIPSIDVHIIIDDNSFEIPTVNTSSIRFIRVNETICIESGFFSSNSFGTGKDCSAWDKAIYFFTRISTRYEFVWFLEADVFIPSTRAFLAVHQLYSSSHDLIVPNVEYNFDGDVSIWYHAYLIVEEFIPPWSYGMVCGMGVSRRLLAAVDEYARWRGHIAFIEFLFHTLALQDPQMKVVAPVELSTIVYRSKYAFEQVQAAPNNWWHPVKDFSLQDQWRKILASNVSTNYSNILRALESVEMQLNHNHTKNSIVDVENEMADLDIQFEIVKSQLKPRTRHQLRGRFLRLAVNRSETIDAIALALANSTYKLMQNIGIYSTPSNKSSRQVKLEAALETTKQTVLLLTKEGNLNTNEKVTLAWLRDETNRIIQEVISEIKCEQGIISCDWPKEWFDLHYEIYRHPTGPSVGNQIFVTGVVFSCILFFLSRMKNKQLN